MVLVFVTHSCTVITAVSTCTDMSHSVSPSVGRGRILESPFPRGQFVGCSTGSDGARKEAFELYATGDGSGPQHSNIAVQLC